MGDEPDHAASTNMGQPSAQTTAPQYSHAGHGQQSLGHSVVPDLMKIYESLTQSKTPQAQQQQPQYQQPPPPPPPQMSQPMHHSAFYPTAPAAAPFPYHPQQFNFAAQPPSEMPAPQYASSEYGVKPVATSSSGRTLRKRSVDKIEDDISSSDGSTSRSRKKKKSDGRWSKRFTWPEELHRDFVSAIFDVGLKHSSPSALLEHMPEHDQITSERVKSHLQKYRLHRAKSKKEFMSCYEASLNNYQATGIKAQSLGSGEVAAHLAYSSNDRARRTDTDSTDTFTV
jgi:SHAQKYF class myb-like DNA-binding protein